MKRNITRLFCGILFLSQLTIAYAAGTQYSIIIDAGSTGSRLHLFQINTQTKMPVIQEIYSESTKPGISSYANHPEAAGASLKILIDHAIEKLNQKNIDPKMVSLNILATAGMRFLPTSSQQVIYQNMTQYLHSNYTLNIAKIETITGKMESLFGWLDVNYLNHTFQDNVSSVGSIDLGGASTQIAFETTARINPGDRMNLKINGHNYSVFATSYLGLGQDQALNAINQENAANACYPKGYPLNQTATGQFDFATCSILYTSLLTKKYVKDEIMSLASKHFIAYSGVYYDLNFLDADKTPDRGIVEGRIQAVCNASWQQLQNNYPTIAPKYLAPACANTTYVYDLLFKTYFLQVNQLTVTNKINNQDIDWTLGAALYSAVTQ